MATANSSQDSQEGSMVQDTETSEMITESSQSNAIQPNSR